MSSQLITATDIALRDRKPGVAAWIRWRAEVLRMQGKLTVIWDGRTVTGAPVAAFVNRSRWIGLCPICGNAEYVCPDTPVFYCLACSNGNSAAALPVAFPGDRERIEAALLKRPVLEGKGANRIEMLLRAREGLPGLARAWSPGVSAETLEQENAEAGV